LNDSKLFNSFNKKLENANWYCRRKILPDGFYIKEKLICVKETLGSKYRKITLYYSRFSKELVAKDNLDKLKDLTGLSF
jgi:hypothetical protein